MKIEGRNAVREFLRAGGVPERCYVEEDAARTGAGRELLEELRRSGCRYTVCPRAALDRMSQTGRHQGVVAEVADYQYAELDDLFAEAERRGEKPLFLMLCGVEDPHNLGSVARVAECAGAHGIILPRHNGCAVNETVCRVSAGAVNHVKIARVTNLNRTMEVLQSRCVWVYGADMDGDPMYEADFADATCLVIGGEGNGINRLTRERCDRIVSIPMFGKVNSLNASVAAGVVLYEAVRQRRR